MDRLRGESIRSQGADRRDLLPDITPGRVLELHLFYHPYPYLKENDKDKDKTFCLTLHPAEC